MSTTIPQTIDPNGIKVISDDQTQQMSMTMTDATNKGLILDYDLTGTAKKFSITNSGVKWSSGATTYTTALDRLAVVQQAFQAVQLPPNSTTLSLNNDIQFSDGVTTADLGIVGTNLQISSTTGNLTSTITQPAASDSTTKIPTTAWVQSAIDAKTNIIDTNTSATYYPLFASDVSNQTFRADKTTTPWTINPNTGDFNFVSSIKIDSTNTTAVGRLAGNTGQGTSATAIGYGAGQTNQRNSTVAVGANAGNNTQGLNSIAVGSASGQTTQGTACVALGLNAGNSSQGNNSVAIGSSSGRVSQATNCTAIGVQSGEISQTGGSVAIGINAGRYGQGTTGNGIAIGNSAGAGTVDASSVPLTPQGTSAIAIGTNCGRYSQGSNSVAIGTSAGIGQVDASGNIVSGTNQGTNAVAIGNSAGNIGQSSGAIAIGNQAGILGQGTAAIAIGSLASSALQHANSIVINASGAALNSDGTSRCFIKPLRNDTTKQNQVQYNTSTSEVSYVAQVISPITTGGLDITGDAALLAVTAGGSAGTHLKIVVNGVTYKIALLNN